MLTKIMDPLQYLEVDLLIEKSTVIDKLGDRRQCVCLYVMYISACCNIELKKL